MQISFANKTLIIISSFAASVSILLVLFPFLSLAIIGANYKIIDTPEFNAKYGALTEGVEYAENMTKVCYAPLFVMQRLAFGGAMVYLYTIPIASVVVMAALHGLMIFYILYFKPFPTFAQRASVAVDELSLIVFLVYAFALAIRPYLSEAKRKTYA